MLKIVYGICLLNDISVVRDDVIDIDIVKKIGSSCLFSALCTENKNVNCGTIFDEHIARPRAQKKTRESLSLHSKKSIYRYNKNLFISVENWHQFYKKSDVILKAKNRKIITKTQVH